MSYRIHFTQKGLAGYQTYAEWYFTYHPDAVSGSFFTEVFDAFRHVCINPYLRQVDEFPFAISAEVRHVTVKRFISTTSLIPTYSA